MRCDVSAQGRKDGREGEGDQQQKSKRQYEAKGKQSPAYEAADTASHRPGAVPDALKGTLQRRQYSRGADDQRHCADPGGKYTPSLLRTLHGPQQDLRGRRSEEGGQLVVDLSIGCRR